MPKTMSFIILFFIVLLLAAGDAPYRKVAGNGMDVYYRDFGAGTPILVLAAAQGCVRSLSEPVRGIGKKPPLHPRGPTGDGEVAARRPGPGDDIHRLTLEILRLCARTSAEAMGRAGFSYGGYLARCMRISIPVRSPGWFFWDRWGLMPTPFPFHGQHRLQAPAVGQRVVRLLERPGKGEGRSQARPRRKDPRPHARLLF